MARITERIRLALKLVKRIRAEAKLQKTSVARFVRTAVERYLDELAKHKIAAKLETPVTLWTQAEKEFTADNTAGKPKQVSLILETPVTLWTQAEKEFTANNTAGKPKQVSLILETPVALWTQAEKEFADEVIQRHFDEDR